MKFCKNQIKSIPSQTMLNPGYLNSFNWFDVILRKTVNSRVSGYIIDIIINNLLGDGENSQCNLEFIQVEIAVSTLQ